MVLRARRLQGGAFLFAGIGTEQAEAVVIIIIIILITFMRRKY